MLGVGFALVFMSVYDCAYVGTQFEGSFIGWASFQGLRLLELPGNYLFVAIFGLEELYNTDPNFLIPFRIGFPALVAMILGLTVGASVCSNLPPADEPQSNNRTDLWGKAALSVALIGTVGFGFVLGLVAFILAALIATQPTRVHQEHRTLLNLAMVVGAMDVVVWTIGLAFQLSI